MNDIVAVKVAQFGVWTDTEMGVQINKYIFSFQIYHTGIWISFQIYHTEIWISFQIYHTGIRIMI